MATLTKKSIVMASLALVTLSGCDIGQHTQTQEFPQFIISVTNSPHPVHVGEPVELFVTLRKERAGVTGCKVTVSQQAELVTADGSATLGPIEMAEGGRSGIYNAKKLTFAQAGRWQLQFGVNCSGKEKQVNFPLDVIKQN